MNGVGSAEGDFDVGVIGAGWIASSYHLPILANIDETSIGYVADIDAGKARELARSYGTDAVEIEDDPSRLPDCDVVLLGVPVGVRAAYVDEFSSRGTPIFSEKPFAVDPDDHRRFVAKSEYVTCNYMRTCYSTTRQLETIVETGLLGDISRIELFDEGKVWGTGFGKDHWQTNVELSGGGVLMEHGVHSLSQLVQVFSGYEIEVGETEIVWNGDLDAEVETKLCFTDGDHRFVVDYRVSRIRPVRERSRFVFDTGVVTANVVEPSEPLRLSADLGVPSQELVLEPAGEWARTVHQAMYLRWKQFLSRIADDDSGPSRARVETAPEVTQTIAGIYGRA